MLVVYHSKTGHTERLINAGESGINDPEVDRVDLKCLRAKDADADDLLWSDGLILGTPENFGYMSGAMKDFFDRTFYEVEGKLSPLPYALVIGAGNDGTGAVRAIKRIANGYPFIEVQAPIISTLSSGAPTPQALTQCKELGMVFAAGLSLGVF